jgi:S1-C subfamily serine protease
VGGTNAGNDRAGANLSTVPLFDLIALGLVGLMALTGFRRGLVAGVLSLVGLIGGAYVGSQLGPSLVGGEYTRWLPLVALVTAMLFGAVGQALGSVLGRHLRHGLVVLGPLRAVDTVGGAALGAATGLAFLWVVGAVLLYIPGQAGLRRQVQDSTILSTLNDRLPPARVIDELARIDPFAAIAGPAASVAPPDPAVLGTAGVNAAALSVVRVVGDACGLAIEGSGWVAAPGLVVTSAHVVAGVDTPRVDRNDGGPLLRARVVAFDRHDDIAVLRVAGLKRRPLRLADPVNGTAAALLGYPANGPYAETPVRVGKDVQIIGRDAYGRFPTSRRVTTIRGSVHGGNSGGPAVDARGRVLTTVFARRPGGDGGYGVPTESVRAALRRVGPTAISTDCVDR